MPQTVTDNLGLALPVNDSTNTPWGPSIEVLAAAIAALDAVLVSKLQQNSFCCAMDTGISNAYVIAVQPAPVLVPFSRFYFKAKHSNTGASTLQVGGRIIPITKNGGQPLSGAEIHVNQIIHVVFDGTEFQMISQ